MALRQMLAPALEPVALSEAKSFLRLDHDDEDEFVSSLIATSRLQIETALNLALIDQQWRWMGLVSGGEPIALRPHPAVSLIGAFEVADDGTETTMAAELVTLNTDSRPASVTVETTRTARAAIDFRAGFGPTGDAVPAPIRQALLQLVAHWYEHREPVSAQGESTTIPMTVSDLLAPYRELRL